MKEEITLPDSLHISGSLIYCTVILPLALDRLYTYAVPEELVSRLLLACASKSSSAKKRGTPPSFIV
jgi:hypothetical protein